LGVSFDIYRPAPMPASNLARVKRRWKTPSVLVGSGVTAAGAIWRGSFQLPGLGGDKRIMGTRDQRNSPGGRVPPASGPLVRIGSD